MIKEEYYLNVLIFAGRFNKEAQSSPKISDKMQIDGIKCDFCSPRNTTAISGDAKITQKRSAMTKRGDVIDNKKKHRLLAVRVNAVVIAKCKVQM